MVWLQGKRVGWVVGVLSGTLYGLSGRLVFAGKNQNAKATIFPIMTFAFVFIMPFALGAITVWFGRTENPKSNRFILLGPWLSCGLMLLSALLFKWEGILCVVLLSPVFLVMSLLGGIVMMLISKKSDKSSLKSVGAIALLPFLIGPLEHYLLPATETCRVTTTVAVRATPERIWPHVARVAPISPDSLPASLVWKIGLPKPREATLSQEGVGGVREARFERGLTFHEPITVWDPPRQLSFAIHVDETTVSPAVLDEHVRVGSTHFDVNRGTFTLEPTGEGALLHLESEHQITTHFNWYAKRWTTWVMAELQRSICQVIKARAEKQ